MIIKSIHIENFMCYYGENTFDLSPGLNIILGENGEGKTNFFEAFYWLFSNEKDRKLSQLVCKKSLGESSEGDNFIVKVKITVKQYDEIRTLSKSFLVTKEEGNNFRTESFDFEGTTRNFKGERQTHSGDFLSKQIIPPNYIQYTLFKGETELEIFKNNSNALALLVRLFSDWKHYQKYDKLGNSLQVSVEKRVSKESKKNKETKRKLESIEDTLTNYNTILHKKKVELRNVKKEMKELNILIEKVEKHFENGEQFQIIQKAIRDYKEKVNKLELQIGLRQEFTKKLFDEKWLLFNFESVIHEYSEKTKNLFYKKRQENNEHIKRIVVEEEKNRYTPLPFDIPPKEIMEEMIKEQFCKVCNRPAKEGSEPLNFMKRRLEEYLESINKPQTETEIPNLFKFSFIDELYKLNGFAENKIASVKEIENDINGNFEVILTQTNSLKNNKRYLENEIEKLNQIVSESSIGTDSLVNAHRDFKGHSKKKNEKESELNRLRMKVEEIERKIEEKNLEKDELNSRETDNKLIETQRIFRDIAMIFDGTKKSRFMSFIDSLKKESNSVFKDMNKGAFTGHIEFELEDDSDDFSIEPVLYQGEEPFLAPNTSLKISMHLSILFAISNLTVENREDGGLPLIFDAPVSSFGETKKAQFFKILRNTIGQSIILLKDFIETDVNGNLVIQKSDFKKIKKDKAFWIKLERPFDRDKLETINTQVIPLS